MIKFVSDAVVFSGFVHHKKLTDRIYNVAEILLKVALSTITLPSPHYIRLKSKRHWRIVHIQIINNHDYRRLCHDSQTSGKVIGIHFNSKTPQSFYFNIIENVWILYIEVHVQRRINNIQNTASEYFPGTWSGSRRDVLTFTLR